MVSIKGSLLAGLACLSAVTNAIAVPRATGVNTDIDTVASRFNALIAPTKEINDVNGAEVIVRQGPLYTVVEGYNSFATSASTLSQRIAGSAKAPAGAHADEITTSFINLCNTMDEQLKLLIGKQGLLSQTTGTVGPVTSTLRSMENAFDVLGNELISHVPSRSADIQKKYDDVSSIIVKAEQAYSLNL